MIIAAPRLFDGVAFTGPGAVRVEAGRIAEVLPGQRQADVVLAHGFLAPGLIDLHNNGAFGVDCATATPDEWDHYISELAARGVTCVLPTVITAPLPELCAAAARVGEAKARHGAILGLHLEGPFLNAGRRGAHQAERLLNPDAAAVDAVLDIAPALLTLAPELPGALAAIRRFTEAGIIVSLGHTNATAVEMLAGADAGARMATHVFNAQSPLGHRAPGAPAVALTDERLFPCLIADGIHVDPMVLQLAFAACPRAIAVTDSILLAGLEPGAVQRFGGAPARLANGAAIRADGTLAGAGITLDEGVRRLIAAGVPIATALAAATSRPASALGLAGHGRLAAGARADLVWFTDNLDVLQVWTAGLCKTPPRRARGTEAARPGLENLEERGTLAIVQEFLAQEASAQRALAAVAADLAALSDAVAERLRAGGRLFYAGAGTSGRLGLLDAVECGPTFGIPEGVIIPILAGGAGAFLNAVEGAEDDAAAAAAALAEHGVGPGDALVAIAASGATPFTLAALRHAARQGALTGAITNSPGSPLAAAAQFPVAIASGAEIIAGSTRLSAGTTQKIALNVLSSTVMIALGKTYGPYMVDLRATNAKLRRRAAAMTAKLAGVDETQARLALEACNMHVKTAIVMLRLGLSAQSAAQHLESADFSLRRALKTSH